jgi:hypothetical protein
MIFVSLGRGHSFTDLSAIQQELNPAMMQLAPRGNHGRFPYLTASGDENIGHRTEIFSGHSDFSGLFQSFIYMSA